MGVLCDTGRVTIEQSINKIEAKKFYDVIISITSIKDIIKGWKIQESENFKQKKEKMIQDKVVKIGIIGNSNKGKSFILSKLSKIKLPSGTSIKTEGLSIKYPDLKKYINRNIVLLDSAGLETPVLKTNNNNSEMGEKGKKFQNNNNIEQTKNPNKEFRDESREKIITESFLQNYIIYNSDILIVVVGILTYSEQKLLNRIKTKLKRENLINKVNNTFLYIIHNLVTYTTISQVDSYIKETLLKSLTFDLEEQIKVNTKTRKEDGEIYYEKDDKNSNLKIFHLIFANDYSEAGEYYNGKTLSFIENSYEKVIGLKGFDIIESVKERFKEVSKDIIENPQEDIEFDNSDNLIKLKKPKKFTLKKLFLDELGFTNLRANGFEPNYNYYRTKNHIIIKIEAPGQCEIETSIQFNGEYIIIKIIGNKNMDMDEKSEILNNLCDRREFGNFSLDIPIKHDNFYIKNESPTIQKNEGIFIISYKIEKSKLGGKYQPKKDEMKYN